VFDQQHPESLEIPSFSRMRVFKKIFYTDFFEITTNGTKNNRNKCIFLQMHQDNLNPSPLNATLFYDERAKVDKRTQLRYM
jgi:hypothetical protein